MTKVVLGQGSGSRVAFQNYDAKFGKPFGYAALVPVKIPIAFDDTLIVHKFRDAYSDSQYLNVNFLKSIKQAFYHADKAFQNPRTAVLAPRWDFVVH